MKGKQQLTNQQLSSTGMKKSDNGEVDHSADKTIKNRKNDNVKSKT